MIKNINAKIRENIGCWRDKKRKWKKEKPYTQVVPKKTRWIPNKIHFEYSNIQIDILLQN